jgi:hypothetical protein
MNWEGLDGGSLGELDLDYQHFSSVQGEGGDVTSTGSDFYDQIMNTGPSLEGLEFSEDKLDAHLEPVGNSVRKARKRTISDVEISDDVRLQEGILFLYNRKIIMMIQIILSIMISP